MDKQKNYIDKKNRVIVMMKNDDGQFEDALYELLEIYY